MDVLNFNINKISTQSILLKVHGVHLLRILNSIHKECSLGLLPSTNAQRTTMDKRLCANVLLICNNMNIFICLILYIFKDLVFFKYFKMQEMSERLYVLCDYTMIKRIFFSKIHCCYAYTDIIKQLHMLMF